MMDVLHLPSVISASLLTRSFSIHFKYTYYMQLIELMSLGFRSQPHLNKVIAFKCCCNGSICVQVAATLKGSLGKAL